MSDLCTLLCSPVTNGVSDQLAGHFMAGFRASGCSASQFALRDYDILPCKGCNACFIAPSACILEKRDQVAEIYAAMKAARLLLFASPIYFYGLPAVFKALVDRGQLFYARRRLPHFPPAVELPPGIAIFSAARKKGKLLFQGASLTLKWFLRCAGSSLQFEWNLYGMESPSNIDDSLRCAFWQAGFCQGSKCQKNILYLT